MDTVKQTCKKVWLRCRRSHAVAAASNYQLLPEKDPKQKKNKKARVVVPPGCFCVEVGAERERFLVKIKLANHPLFKMLLDDAEKEYGFQNDGPIRLPCHVDLFCDALEEMESHIMPFAGCTFPKANSSVFHSPLSRHQSSNSHRASTGYELSSVHASYRPISGFHV
ncbi:hypothetical protein L6164_010912 [Bauhinia variegata]|uniref:Uncharacterized protein n=1 Tax=Bauhinia variegata TaxID=167791 RepID=A0ACB9P509_BAUVA|nr:hypothetical protein L6164_010912 [Bauhinia variegata]